MKSDDWEMPFSLASPGIFYPLPGFFNFPAFPVFSLWRSYFADFFSFRRVSAKERNNAAIKANVPRHSAAQKFRAQREQLV